MAQDNHTATLTDEELAEQSAFDMKNREQELRTLDSENQKLRQEN